ncbi:MAG: hypothetical protein Ct9H300mP16_10760 [Pseudomonadota bacterium]|nr:MAG: hypothetical protein Ct9H300mP16_10760 [Pseudomonadota bacterium]
MPSRKVSPYGSWDSPFTAELITQGGPEISEVRVDGPDLYWGKGATGPGWALCGGVPHWDGKTVISFPGVSIPEQLFMSTGAEPTRLRRRGLFLELG